MDTIIPQESRHDIFVIPHKNQGIVARCHGDIVEEIGRVDTPFAVKNLVTENGLLACLCHYRKKTTLKFFDPVPPQQGGVCRLLYALDVPGAMAMSAKGNVLYLGGHVSKKGGENFALLNMEGFSPKDTEGRTPTLTGVPLPVRFGAGKAIDDVLCWGDSLVLVDDIVFPKYLFRYDISVPTAPRHLSTEDLADRTYERLYKGAMNADYLVLLSGAVGMWGSGSYITVKGKQEMCIEVHKDSRHETIIESRTVLRAPCLRLVEKQYFHHHGDDSADDDEHTLLHISLPGEAHIRNLFLIGNILYFRRIDTLFTFDLDAPLPALNENPESLSKEEARGFDAAIPLPDSFHVFAEIPPNTCLIQTPNKAILAVGEDAYQVIVPSS
jgi:prepilin-type processing-associated H-X9-DG protein